MVITPIDEAQRKAAKVAGFAYLISFAAVVFAQFHVHARLIVEHNAAATARNILAHQRLFRVGIGFDLVYCAATVVLLSAFYVVLRPVDRNLALLAAFFRLIWAFMWVQMTVNLFDALRMLSGADYLQAFEPERLQALARLYLGERFDQYYVGLLFCGLASAICSYLWFRSRYIPRALAAWGVLSSIILCRVYLRFYPFPELRQDPEPVVVRHPNGYFRYRHQRLAPFERVNSPASIRISCAECSHVTKSRDRVIAPALSVAYGHPDCRWASSQLCKISTAAIWSITSFLSRAPRPTASRWRCASAVLIRSSHRCTGRLNSSRRLSANFSAAIALGLRSPER